MSKKVWGARYTLVAHYLSKNTVIRLMRITCWMTKATDTHSECVTLIAFPRQEWLTQTRLNVAFLPTLPVFDQI
jgi:hypothetical protein